MTQSGYKIIKGDSGFKVMLDCDHPNWELFGGCESEEWAEKVMQRPVNQAQLRLEQADYAVYACKQRGEEPSEEMIKRLSHAEEEYINERAKFYNNGGR